MVVFDSRAEIGLAWIGLSLKTTAFIPYLSKFDSGDPLVLLAVQELQSARDRAWFETQKHHQLVAPGTRLIGQVMF